MSPGNQNGKNYGGGHTGSGKKARKGIYSTNGLRYRRLSHREFTPDLEVYYVKNGERGVIMENNIKGPRKMKKVKFIDNILYIPSNLLYPINYSANEINMGLNNIKEISNKKKVRDYEKMKINNEKRKEFRKAKKSFRREIIEDGVYVDYSNSNSEKKFYNSKFVIRKVSNNKLIKELNEDILKAVISLDKQLNNIGIISVNESNISKQRVLDIYMSTGCGSTSSIHNISNKSDYYDIICKYMGREESVNKDMGT